jgi:hypothetical protein
VQDIDAYAERDFERPMRDAFVGMLPPKLAQIMLNLAVGEEFLESRVLSLRRRPTHSSSLITHSSHDRSRARPLLWHRCRTARSSTDGF